MEFIITTFTMYCAYQDLELQSHVMKMKSSACKPTKQHDASSCCYLVSTKHVNSWYEYLGVHIIFVNT